jgi:maleylacetoacetate isomerase
MVLMALHEEEPRMILYTYWRSSAAHRVRIALGLKGIRSDDRYINLLEQEQRDDSYLAANPQGTIPSIDDDGVIANQSLAIIEYLDETRPKPPLLPSEAAGRARVRAMSLHIACEIHPVITPRTVNAMGDMLGASPEARGEWTCYWTNYGLTAFEKRLSGDTATGRYCHGDVPTMADVCMVPQLHLARSQGYDLSDYPTMLRIETACMDLEAFQAAMPEEQPDSPIRQGS